MSINDMMARDRVRENYRDLEADNAKLRLVNDQLKRENVTLRATLDRLLKTQET